MALAQSFFAANILRDFQNGAYSAWANEFKSQKEIVQLKMVIDLFENLDCVTPENYSQFLSDIIVGVFVPRLRNEPVFVECAELRIRSCILNIIERIPRNEHLFRYVETLLDLLYDIVLRDNEENAIASIRMVSDLFSYRNLDSKVVPFYALFKTALLKFQTAFQNTLLNQTALTASQNFVSTPNVKKPSETRVFTSDSLKLLIEFPTIFVMVWRHYPKLLISRQLAEIIALLVDVIKLSPPPESHENPSFQDLLNAQSLCLTCLIVLLKDSDLENVRDIFKPISELPNCIIRLLKTHPLDSSVRKDIISAVRHLFIISSQYKKQKTLQPYQEPKFEYLYPDLIVHIDDFCNIEVILGPNNSSHLQHYAVSLIADFIYIPVIREQLTLNQLSRLANFYALSLSEQSNYSLSFTVIYRLLHVVDPLTARQDDFVQRREIVLKLVQACANKLDSLKELVPVQVQIYSDECINKMELCKEKFKTFEKRKKGLKNENAFTEEDKTLEKIKEGKNKSKLNFSNKEVLEDLYSDSAKSSINYHDLRTMINTLIEKISKCLTLVNEKFDKLLPNKLVTINEDIFLFDQLLCVGIKCMSIYYLPCLESIDLKNTGFLLHVNDSKKDFENLYLSFHYLDSNMFAEIFEPRMPFLLEEFYKNPILYDFFDVMTKKNYLNGKVFIELCLSFLCNKISTAESIPEFATIHKIFKILFLSINLNYKNDLEVLLNPYVNQLVITCVEKAVSTVDSINYLTVIKLLFRNFSIQKTSDSILKTLFTKELMDVLPRVVKKLNKLYDSATTSALRDLIIELMLSIPVRESTLLMTFNIFIKFLICALESTDIEIYISQMPKWLTGLKFLENIVEKFNSEYLNLFLDEYKPRLMKALWSQLRPIPTNFTSHIFRILGRMGGKNRHFMIPPHLSICPVQYKKGVHVTIPLKTNSKLEIPLHSVIHAARRLLLSTVISNSFWTPLKKQQSFSILKTIYSLFFQIPNSSNTVKTKEAFNFNNYTMFDSGVYSPKFIDPESPIPILIRPDYSFKVSLNSNGEEIINNNQNSPKSSYSDSKIEDTNSKLITDYEADKTIFKLLSNTIIISSVIEHVPKEEINSFLDNVVAYFALIYASDYVADISHLLELDPKIFIESVIDVLVCENREHAKAALVVLDRLFFVWNLISNSSEKFQIENLSILEFLFYHLCEVCYKKGWNFKMGGLMGLKYLIQKLSISLTQNYLKILLHAIFYMFKDSADVSSKTLRDEIDSFISFVIKTYLDGNNNPIILNNILDALMANLMSTDDVLRIQIRKYLNHAAKLSGIPIVELITPYKACFVSKIFEFPFLKFSKKQKIICLDTLNYLLSIKPLTLDCNQNMMVFFSQVVGLLESDASISSKLQVLIVEVLVSALGFPEISVVLDQNSLRVQIISVFLKCLSRKPEQLENSVRRGLEILFQQNSSVITKKLQNILKSTLQNLNSGNLTEKMINFFHKYIMLSPKMFTPTLGDKLVEQLMRKVDTDSSDNNRHRTCAAIIDLLALLSSNTEILPQIVLAVIKLESFDDNFKSGLHNKLQMQTASSTLKNSLTKYLNKYPAEALLYFFSKFAVEPNLFYLFLKVFRNPEANELRAQFSNYTHLIIESGAFKSQSMSEEAYRRRSSIIAIINLLVSFNNDWLFQHKDVFESLYGYLVSPQFKEKPIADIPRFQLYENKNLLICFIEYLKLHHTQNIFLLFDMAYVFTCTKHEQYYFLDSFYKDFVINHYTIDEKKTILIKFFGEYFYVTKPYLISDNQKYQVLKHLIVPMIIHSLNNFNESNNHENLILTSNIINNYFVKIYTISNEKDVFLNLSNQLSIELLRLAALIIKKNNHILEDQRKEFIRFAWHFLKNDDLFTRQSAYLLVSRFICSYETPIRIILQIYKALVKAYHAEFRHLVKEALDVLLCEETVNKLKNESINGVSGWILLIRFTRKTLIEEAHNLSYLVHILKLLVRQDANFYKHRSFFAPHILNSLSRVSVIPNLEAKKLAFNIVEMILNWEKKRISHENSLDDTSAQTNLHNEQEPKIDGDINNVKKVDVKPNVIGLSDNKSTTNHPALIQEDDDKDFKLNHFQMDLIVNLLVSWATATFLSFIHDPNQEIITLYSRSLGLLSDALLMWPVVNLKFSTLTRFWDDTRHDFLKGTISSLCVLHTILKTHAKNYLDLYSNELNKLTVLLFSWNSVEIFRAYNRCLRIIVSTYPCHEDSPIQPLYTSLISNLEKNFETTPFDMLEQFLMSLKILTCQGETGIVLDENCASLRLTLPVVSKDIIFSFLPILVRVFKRLVEEYIACDNYSLQNQNPEQHKSKIDPNLILFILKLLVEKLEYLKEVTNDFLWTFQLLIDKSSDELFLLHLVPITYFFIRSSYLNLSFSEINVYILKLRRCEKARTLPLSRIYYDVIYSLYNNLNVELKQINQLEFAVMSALFQRDIKIREKFLNIFKRNLKDGIFEYLKVIFNNETWKVSPSFLSISQAVELILLQFDLDSNLKLSNNCALMSLPVVSSQKNNHAGGAEESSFGTEASEAMEFKHTEKMDVIYDSDQKSFKELETVIENTANFLMTFSSLTVRNLLDPLNQIIFFEFELSKNLWITLFSSIWNQLLISEEREELIVILENFFSPNSNTCQMPSFQPDFVKAIIQGVAKCHSPKLLLSSPLLSLVGSNYCTWNTSLFMLEERLMDYLLGISETCPGVAVDYPNHPPILYESLCNLYSKLDEKDHLYGVWVNRSVVDDTRAGLIYAQQGVWNRAQEVFYQALQDYNRKLLINVPQFEMRLWESQWVECARKLNQWDVLASYGQKINSPKLSAEALWKMDEWNAFRELLEKQNLKDNSYKTKFFQIYLCLNDCKMSQVDTLAKSAMSLIVNKWNTYPHTPACPAYTRLLQAMQSTLEFYESGKIIRELKSQDVSNKVVDLKSNLLKMWRERLPHQCDDIIIWHEILQWRQHVFSMVTQVLNNITPSASLQSSIQGLGHHETAWIINKIAQIARKQGLLNIAFNALPKIYQLINIEIQDAFTKVREHIKCWFKLPMPLMLGGFDIIVTTNLEFFTPPQKAQFYQLKGDFYAKSGAYEEASKAYSLAIGTFSSLSQAWTAWGKFYDEKFEAYYNHLKSASNEKPLNFKPLGPLSEIENLTTERITAAFYAIFCYLRGIQSNSCASSRKVLGRAIWLLNYDIEIANNSFNISELEDIIERELEKANNDSNFEDYQDCKIKHENENDVEFFNGVNSASALNASRESEEKSAEDKMVLISGTPNSKYLNNSLNTPVTVESGQNFVDHSENLFKLKSNHHYSQKLSEIKKLGLLKSMFFLISKYLPPWIWISWIPQLTAGLFRSEAVLMHSILKEVGNAYTSAVFYQLRSFVQKLKEKTSSNGTHCVQENDDRINFDNLINENCLYNSENNILGSFALKIPPKNLGNCEVALKLAENCLANLYYNSPCLLNDLDKIASNITRVFKPSIIEEALEAFYAVRDTITDNTISPSNKLNLVYKKLNVINNTIINEFPKVRQTSFFNVSEYSGFLDIQKQLDEEINKFSTSLSNILDKLNCWIKILLFRIQKKPRWANLNKNEWLVNFQNEQKILVFESIAECDSEPDNLVFINKFEMPVRIIKSRGYFKRLLTVRGTDGKIYQWWVEVMSSFKISLEGDNFEHRSIYWAREHRHAQILNVVKRYLSKDLQIKKRGVNFTVPDFVSLSSRSRIISINRDAFSLDDLYLNHCQMRGLDVNAPIKINQPRYLQESPLDDEELLEIYLKSKEVTYDNLLNNFLLEHTNDNYDGIWHLKKISTGFYAIYSLTQYLFSTVLQAIPRNIFFIPENGVFQIVNNYPKLSSDGDLVETLPVSVRLTQNILRFIGPILHGGFYDAIFTAASHCLSKPTAINHINQQLMIYNREDLHDLEFSIETNLLFSKIQKNANSTCDKIKKIFSLDSINYRPETTKPINEKITLLLKSATDCNLLSKSPVNWVSWM